MNMGTHAAFIHRPNTNPAEQTKSSSSSTTTTTAKDGARYFPSSLPLSSALSLPPVFRSAPHFAPICQAHSPNQGGRFVSEAGPGCRGSKGERGREAGEATSTAAMATSPTQQLLDGKLTAPSVTRDPRGGCTQAVRLGPCMAPAVSPEEAFCLSGCKARGS